jgi:hypothetical protein
MGGEKFNPGTEYIRWDYEGEDKTFNIEFLMMVDSLILL